MMLTALQREKNEPALLPSDLEGHSRLINLLASYGIRGRVLSAFDEMPRELFVDKKLQLMAYEDHALPIGEGQTISQPSLVALMLRELNLTGKESVLEIGSGSGFQTALLSRLAGKVYSIERIKSLAQKARARLESLGIKNAEIFVGDGTLGLQRQAPFDAIIVTAFFKKVPEPLSQQLKSGGLLIMPVGEEENQTVVLYKKFKNKKLAPVKELVPVRFVPLIGKHAWVKKQ